MEIQAFYTKLTAQNSDAISAHKHNINFDQLLGVKDTDAEIGKPVSPDQVLKLLKPSYAARASEITPISVPDMPEYQDIIDQMMFKANQSANQMSDEGRKRASAEFEDLSKKLVKHLEDSSLFHPNVMPIVRDYIMSLDISTKETANKTFNDMYNLDHYVSNLDGTWQDPPPPAFQHIETLRELMHMANRSANYMTDDQRKALNEQFHAKMEQFLDELEESGVIQNDYVMQVMHDYLSQFDIGDQQQAQRAFNELYNLENYLGTLV